MRRDAGTAWSSATERTSAPASRTPRCTRSRKPGTRARGATLYCTLEPCVHTGRTGPCTERIIAAGITRVVAAMEDPYPLRAAAAASPILREHGIAVEAGVERDAAVRLNQPFLTADVAKGGRSSS